MRKITARLLVLKGACDEQVRRFRKLFPRGVVPTVELAEAYANTFSWDWAAQHLLSATAQAEYERVTATAQAEYERVRATARAEYERVRAPAQAEYERVRARAFVELWDRE